MQIVVSPVFSKVWPFGVVVIVGWSGSTGLTDAVVVLEAFDGVSALLCPDLPTGAGGGGHGLAFVT